jgi:outer membrane protein OmpA-like peptidoglycan-associated protein
MWNIRALLAFAALVWGSTAHAISPFVVFFAPNSTSMIQPNSDVMLNNAAETFRIHDVREIWLVAHADRTGSAEYNQELSRRRAEAVRKELIRRGYSGNFVIKAYGEGRPLVETEDGAAQRENRRVEINMGCFHNPSSAAAYPYMRCEQ